MKFKVLAIFLLISSDISFAQNINVPPPVGLLLLQYEKIYEGEPYVGRNNHKEYCYTLDTMYVVYSHNIVGQGYSFYKAKPNQNCITSKSKISRKSNLGLTVGVSKEQAVKLLGIELIEGDNKVVWNYQRPIYNLAYDDITTLNITIKDGIVYAVSLFNTITN